jgi:hypothetical protein
MSSTNVDFFVVGAARAGTTSIYNYLSKHPKIFLPNVKECNFFSNVESMDYEVYETPEEDKQYHMKIIKSFEIYQSLFKNAKPNEVKGEVSPSYLWDKDSAKRIYEYNPRAKIIISLRNPIHRAFSHYLMHYNTGYEKEKCFEDALKAKKNKIWGGGNQYLEMSLYNEQIKMYFKYFDKENIKILIYEDWIKDIGKYVNEIYSFLGIDTIEEFKMDKKHNESVTIKNRKVINFFRQKTIKRALNKVLSDEFKEKIKKDFFSDISEKVNINLETYVKLQAYYKADVAKLEDFLKIPLSEKWQFNYDK